MTSFTPEHWDGIKALFDELYPLPGEERAARLAAAAPELAREVQALLQEHDAEEGADRAFLSSALLAWPAPPQRRGPGQRLGPWRLASPLGEGGRGEVWLVERDDGSFQGRAAAKLLRAGLSSAQVLSRFALERQALARLNHPHIARLLDAGADTDGAPYFVMEYVDGQPIHEAVRGRSLEDRLALFLQLADAVSHAHRHLLVHRDLKPSNVLVDTTGQVKLLDFGIAKALEPEDLEPGAADAAGGGTTVFGQRPFTPSHASPEQVRGEPIGTPTDIYSLGVLLYQMLTGTRPTGRGLTSPAALARSVLEDEPTRPSRLTDAEASDADWPRNRRRLEGDLDNILLKALEKEPERRYASVDAMATDVRAYLAGWPVSARQASPAYVLSKFILRHRGIALALGLGVLGLAGGLAATLVQGQWAIALGTLGLGGGLVLALVQARAAAQARDTAQARFDDLRQLARSVLLDYDRLVEPLVGSTPVRQRLVSDALAYLERLSRAAPDDRQLRLEMGVAYRTVGYVQYNGFGRPHLGDRAGAMHSYAQAATLLQPLVDTAPHEDEPAYELALALSARAGVWANEGDMVRAAPPLEQSAALFSRHLQPDRPDLRNRLELARTHLRLASGWVAVYDSARALAAAAQAEQHLHHMARLQPDHPELDHVWVWVNVIACRAHRAAGQWPRLLERTEHNWRILERLRQREPDNGRFIEDQLHIHGWRLNAAGATGDLAGVRREGDLALAGFRRLAERDSEDTNTRRNLHVTLVQRARALGCAGAPEEAMHELDTADEELAGAQRRWPADLRIGLYRVMVADARVECLLGLGRTGQAWQTLAQAKSWMQADPPPPEAADPQWPLASLALRYAEAELHQHAARAAPGDAALSHTARHALQGVVEERKHLLAAGLLVNTRLVWRSERAEPALRELAA